MKFALPISLLLAPLSALCAADGKPAQPNFVFILADDLGVRDLGCYGSDYYRTPCLDALAREGIRFTRAYTDSHVCSPTRASLLTGLYPHRVHITDALPWDRLPENPKMVPPDYAKELPTNLPTYAKALRAAGYRTALVGKWHLGNERVFYLQKGHEAYGFDEAFDVDSAQDKWDKGVDLLTARALDFIEKNRDRPFALSLHHHTPHVPLAAPPKYLERVKDLPRGQFQKNKTYAAMMEQLDDSVQQVLAKLNALGIAENTVVIFTSDNGGYSGETDNRPFRGGKGNLYEGGIRVPLIVRWPGVVKSNAVCDTPVHSVDFFPTFLQIAGLPQRPEDHLDGQSLVPLLRQEQTAAFNRRLFWHSPHYHMAPQSAMISGDWKLVYQIESDTAELYNLRSDPNESQNVAAVHPEVATRLRQILDKHLTDSGAQRMRPNPQWDPSRPQGRSQNFGVFYPMEGAAYGPLKDKPYPTWFGPN